MKIVKCLLIFFTIPIFIGVSIGCNQSGVKTSNFSQTNTSTKLASYNGQLQATVFSQEQIIFSKSGKTEEIVQNSSLPKLWLVFSDSSNNFKNQIEVPVEAMTELNSYFQQRVKFCLASTSDIDLLKESNRVTNQLLRVEIDAPDGKRRISEIEADRLIEFIANGTAQTCKS